MGPRAIARFAPPLKPALEEVDQYKYLGATITKDGTSEADIRIRLATSISVLIRLNTIWTNTKMAIKQNVVYIKHRCSKYYSMDAKLASFDGMLASPWEITEKMENKNKSLRK